MTYGNATFSLATALDTAHHEDGDRHRTLRAADARGPLAGLRTTVGTGLVRLGQRMLPQGLEAPPHRARASGT